jgi:hypothetical protein
MLSQGFLDNSDICYDVEVHIFIFFCQPKQIFLHNFGGFEPVNTLISYALVCFRVLDFLNKKTWFLYYGLISLES